MWRYGLLGLGGFAALVTIGFTRNWLRTDYEIIPFAVWILCWLVPLWKWRLDSATLAFGLLFISEGALVAIEMPLIINNGSGQDAVDGFAYVAGGFTVLLGLFLLAISAVLRAAHKPKQWPSP